MVSRSARCLSDLSIPCPSARHPRGWLPALLLAGLLWSMLGIPPAPVVAQAADEVCFPETGQCLAGRFLDFWRDNGGLAVFGYPITPARWEPNADAGAAGAPPIRWTQWFERARFEHQPQRVAPFDVALGRLGEERLRQQGRDWWTAFPPGQPRPDCAWFATRHALCDYLATGEAIGFRDYYQRQGQRDAADATADAGVALFGLPLSEPQPETDAGGRTVVSQWFERGRFEWQPGRAAPDAVRLGRLGAEVLTNRRFSANTIVGAAATDESATTVRVTAALWVQPAPAASTPAPAPALSAAALTADGAPVAGATAEAVPLAVGASTASVTIRLADPMALPERASIRVCQERAAGVPDSTADGGARACLTFPYRAPWERQLAARTTGPAPIVGADPFRGVCRISREGFGRLLRERAAPDVAAERDAGEYWDAIRAQRIDPLLVAAIFDHESQMGARGVARTTRSWGNTRAPSFGALPVGTVAGRTGAFPVFASWLDGAISTAARLSAPDWVYADRSSIESIFVHPSGRVWAPAQDQNDPDAYLRRVLAFMNRFTDQEATAC